METIDREPCICVAVVRSEKKQKTKNLGGKCVTCCGLAFSKTNQRQNYWATWCNLMWTRLLQNQPRQNYWAHLVHNNSNRQNTHYVEQTQKKKQGQAQTILTAK
jgi:hypothetical protein